VRLCDRGLVDQEVWLEGHAQFYTPAGQSPVIFGPSPSPGRSDDKKSAPRGKRPLQLISGNARTLI
jgi:hypothetical protein